MSQAKGMTPVEILYVLRMRARKYRERADTKEEKHRRKFMLDMAEELGRLANEIAGSI